MRVLMVTLMLGGCARVVHNPKPTTTTNHVRQIRVVSNG